MIQLTPKRDLYIHRGDLWNVLYKHAKEAGVQIEFGVKVTDIDARVPRVSLESGQNEGADLIVGADGE